MGKTIQFLEAGVIDAYKNGSPTERTFIERLIGGKDKLPVIDITERVKSYEDACEVLGIQPATVIDMDWSTPWQRDNPEKVFARHQQDVICEALNGDWEADWKDTSQPKWRTWMEWNGSGFRFYYSDGSCLISSVGSRLYFRDERLADYFCKQFTDLHNQAM